MKTQPFPATLTPMKGEAPCHPLYREIRTASFTVALAALLWGLPWASPQAADYQQTEEFRSIISTAEGNAFVSSTTPEEEGWERAFNTAAKTLAQKSRIALQERITGKNKFLFFKIQKGENGEEILPVKKERLSVKNNGKTTVYQARFTGEMRYRLVTDLPQETLLTDPNLPLTVKVWSDKTEYKEGEGTVFYLKGNRDFFARMFDVAADGTTIQLLPNEVRKFRFFRGGQTYSIPDPQVDKELKFEVGPPFGKETVIIYASEAPLGNLLFKDFIGGTFGQVEGSAQELSQTLKNLAPTQELITEKGGAFRFVEFVEGRWTLRTSAQ